MTPNTNTLTLEDLQQLQKEYADKTQQAKQYSSAPCPNCGFCPCCGRPVNPWSANPWYWPHYYPYSWWRTSAGF